jgi:hypothetical protein
LTFNLQFQVIPPKRPPATGYPAWWDRTFVPHSSPAEFAPFLIWRFQGASS